MFVIIILLTIKLNLTVIQCRLIFEDDFNHLDSDKWQFIGEKAKCAKIIDQDEWACNTKNQLNLRTIEGNLALTAHRGKYFDSSFTTAAIVSKKTFDLTKLTPSLLIKIRASIPIIKGLVPRIYLSSLNEVLFDDVHLTILDYNVTFLSRLLGQSTTANLPKDIDLIQFQEYEIIFDKSEYLTKFFLNGQELISKDTEDDKSDYLDLNIHKYKFNLIIALDVDKDKFDQEQSFTDTISCHSFIIDYIKVYEYNSSEDYQVEIGNIKNSIEVCNDIKFLEDKAYIMLIPENYSLLFSDEFDGDELDKDNWHIENETNVNHCNQGSDSACKRNIEVSDGKLNLFSTHDIDGRVGTNACFKFARIEIRAKFSVENGTHASIDIMASENGCNNGITRGYISVFRIFGCHDCFQASMFIAEGKRLISYPKSIHENFSEYQIYGIEWSEEHIQWFINDRVFYQANRMRDVDGNTVLGLNKPSYLPFDHSFSLSFKIGLDKWYRSDRVLPMLEIDYVRVYGKNPLAIIQNLKNEPAIVEVKGQGESDKFSSPLIIGMSSLLLIVVTLLIGIVLIWRRMKGRINQAQTELYYDDITDKDEAYEEIMCDHHYDDVTYGKKQDDQAETIETNEYLEITNHKCMKNYYNENVEDNSVANNQYFEMTIKT